MELDSGLAFGVELERLYQSLLYRFSHMSHMLDNIRPDHPYLIRMAVMQPVTNA